MDDETLGASTTPSLVYAGAFAACTSSSIRGPLIKRARPKMVSRMDALVHTHIHTIDLIPAEALFLGGAVLVLGVALLMLAGMFPALSTPSKTMVVMLAANLGGALVSLLQALYLLVFLARGRYLEQGGDESGTQASESCCRRRRLTR